MFQSNLLREERILITGGGTGLGKAMAKRFLELGAELYICGRRAEVLTAAQAELKAVSEKIRVYTCDVRSLEQVEGMVSSIWNDGPLSTIVNNAAGNILGRSEDLSPRAFEAVIGIVLNGTINVTLACGRRWLAARHPGVVLNIAATYHASGSAYVVPSAVAKSGVVALTRSLAVEWGNRGIRLNAIAPGPIYTEGAFSRLLPRPEFEEQARDRIPSGRFGTLEELADLATFLVSDGSGYINGEVVTMDGGEWLQGAGEFSSLGRMLTEGDWQQMKPRKK